MDDFYFFTQPWANFNQTWHKKSFVGNVVCFNKTLQLHVASERGKNKIVCKHILAYFKILQVGI